MPAEVTTRRLELRRLRWRLTNGRVVIPMELRRTLGIGEKDGLEIFVDGQRIILQKYAPGCMFCEETGPGMAHLFGKLVCPECIAKIKQLYDKNAHR
ncbi:AbrB/MazE/SpoVT family DNA-binding domain-containing protein [Paenibacillus sp. HN-1]|nr:AbrB/MazE/SpoVT family DNA-binding domain-containing protein [Paenibacillus sp. CGMCC 1.18879]MBY9086068.1 AbrB/MazE/SpoVT family DNA-binding domain-containing protein [Paenibacillus sinensis]